MSWRRAVADAWRCPIRLSSTMRAFSAALHRLGRPVFTTDSRPTKLLSLSLVIATGNNAHIRPSAPKSAALTGGLLCILRRFPSFDTLHHLFKNRPGGVARVAIQREVVDTEVG